MNYLLILNIYLIKYIRSINTVVIGNKKNVDNKQ